MLTTWDRYHGGLIDEWSAPPSLSDFGIPDVAVAEDRLFVIYREHSGRGEPNRIQLVELAAGLGRVSGKRREQIASNADRRGVP